MAPGALADSEVEDVLRRVDAAAVEPRPKLVFAVGQKVKIVDGPFRDFTGTVEEFNPERSRVKVSLSIFGRPVPVVLELVQLEAA